MATICLNAARSTYRARAARPLERLDGEAGPVRAAPDLARVALNPVGAGTGASVAYR